MTMPSLPRLGLLLGLAITSLSLHAACARSVTSESESVPVLLSPDAGKTLAQDFCIETKCPAPYATCAGESGLCTTNLKSDVYHCGSCDTHCPGSPQNATSLCSGGECRLACYALFADCNGVAADGCETSLERDPANCGGCKNACKDGVLCWLGACGCPNGFAQCGSECKKLDSDARNCGACGNVCGPPTDPADPAWLCGPNVIPDHTTWACLSSACGLSCVAGHGDCNNQLCTDGCEVDLTTDSKNCGVCGRACDANQACVDGTCQCPAGTVRCRDGCVDIGSDPRNCGACGLPCPGPSSHDPQHPGGGGPECVGGTCSYVCFPGFADCDKNVDNGCEVHLPDDPFHCGSCTTPCKGASAGQPCVEGQCLTKDCDAGVVN